MGFASSSVPDEGSYKGVYVFYSSNGSSKLLKAGGWSTLSSSSFSNLISGGSVPSGRTFTEVLVKVEEGDKVYFTLGDSPSNAESGGDFVDEFYQSTIEVKAAEAYSLELAGLGSTQVKLHSAGTSTVRVIATFA